MLQNVFRISSPFIVANESVTLNLSLSRLYDFHVPLIDGVSTRGVVFLFASRVLHISTVLTAFMRVDAKLDFNKWFPKLLVME